MTDVIRCEGLTKRYQDVTALDGLDLSVPAGQVFGFLGPNGAGKTTTLRILLGLIRPTAGKAWINGKPLPDPASLTGIGAMIEEPAFYPWLTGRRNLEVLALTGPPRVGPPRVGPPRAGPPAESRPGDTAPAGDDPVGAALDRVGLTRVAGRKVKGYSQGMRQRLGLAAALLRRPSLLLLDEPANGLDPAGIAEFRTLLRDLAGEGTTVFLSSHLLAEVEQVCDQVAVLRAGRLVEQGPVAGLATARPRVRVSLDPDDLPAALSLLARWPARADGPGDVLVEGADGRAVNETLGRGGIWARQLTLARPGLEETFLSLTETTDPEVGSAAASR